LDKPAVAITGANAFDGDHITVMFTSGNSWTIIEAIGRWA
jgi:hypothetical protein